jgi:nucleolar protein 4
VSQLEVVPLNLKACRLIVRNLPFACDEAKLAKHFSASGRVAEASMPRSEDGKKKGFGFVQMETMAEAIAALRSLNESKLLGRTVAVDWALSKGQYHSIVAKVQESAAASAAAGGKPEKAVTVKQEVKDEDADEDDEDEAEADEDDDDEEEEKTGRSDAANRAEDEESDGDADSDTDAAREQSNGSRAKGKGAKMEDEGDDADVSDEEKDKHVSKLTAAQVEAEIDNAEELRQRNEREIERGGTIFIRNVAYETTEDGLKQRFSEFGTVRMAKVSREGDF